MDKYDIQFDNVIEEGYYYKSYSAKSKQDDDKQIYSVKRYEYLFDNTAAKEQTLSLLKTLKDSKQHDIIKPYDFYIKNEKLHCVTVNDKKQAEPLADLLSQWKQGKNVPNMEQKMEIFSQVTDAAVACCNFGFKSNVEPCNILVFRIKGQYFIKLKHYYLNDVLDKNTMTVASLGYCAPEELKENKYMIESVVWNLGCLLYEIINLTSILQATTKDQIIEQIINYSFILKETWNTKVNSLLKSIFCIENRIRIKDLQAIAFAFPHQYLISNQGIIYAQIDGTAQNDSFTGRAKVHGFTSCFGNQFTYEGDVVKNQLYGHGQACFKVGAVLEGEYKDNKRNGAFLETYTYPQKFSGYYIDDKRTGYGTYTFDSSDQYSGQYANGYMNGYGLYQFSDKRVYEGQFKDDQKSGFGKFMWQEGHWYFGEFSNNLMNGFGRYVITDGREYVGMWQDDKRSGYGVFSWPSGIKYCGEWNDLMLKGTMTWPIGDKYTGDFQNDKRNGNGTFWYSKTNQYGRYIYKGQWKDDYFHGFGEMTYKNGDKYVGNYDYDKQHGYGEMSYFDENIYFGNWKNDKRDGLGVVVSAVGKKQKGEYEDGTIQNEIIMYGNGRVVMIERKQ